MLFYLFNYLFFSVLSILFIWITAWGDLNVNILHTHILHTNTKIIIKKSHYSLLVLVLTPCLQIQDTNHKKKKKTSRSIIRCTCTLNIKEGSLSLREQRNFFRFYSVRSVFYRAGWHIVTLQLMDNFPLLVIT